MLAHTKLYHLQSTLHCMFIMFDIRYDATSEKHSAQTRISIWHGWIVINADVEFRIDLSYPFLSANMQGR